MTKYTHIEYGHGFKIDPKLAEGFKERSEFYRKRHVEAIAYCLGDGPKPEWWDEEMDYE